MTVYNKRAFRKAIGIFLFFILFTIVERISLNIQTKKTTGLSEFITAYFDMELGYQYTDLSRVTYHFLPVFAFLILFGIQLYDDWRTGSIYKIIRYQSRTQYYIKRIRILLLEAISYTFLHETMILFLYFLKAPLQLNSLDFAYLLTWFFLETTLLFVLSIAMSLLSLRFGASYGLLSIVILFVLLIKLSLFIISCNELVTRIGCFGIWQINILYLIKNKTLSGFQWAAIPFHMFSVCVFGKYWIKHYDVGLCDKEQE